MLQTRPSHCITRSRSITKSTDERREPTSISPVKGSQIAHDALAAPPVLLVPPPQARREKPRVSAFTSANIDKIIALKPDLVLTFSDLQADIAADLIRH